MKHLRHEADCLAWPWVSVAEFGHGASSFDRGRALAELRDRMRQHGCPEITRELVDFHWRDGERLTEMLPALARERLLRGADAWNLVPTVERPGQEILAWRYLSLVLPPGLLAAAAAAGGRRPPLHIDILHGSFGPVGPVAHLHLHVGAASSFELLWTHLMSRRDRVKLGHDAKLPAGWSAAGRTRDDWVITLVAASLARRVFAVLARRREASVEDAQKRVGCEDVELVRETMWQLQHGSVRPRTRLAAAMMFRLATRNSRRWRPPRTVDEVWRNDPIDDEGDWPEGAMLAAMFTRLANRRGEPDALEPVFVQYLRIKCLLYRVLVHDATDHGLDSFIHTFHQISPYRAGLERVLPDFAMAERGIELRALEVRTSPPDSVTEVRAAAKNLEVAARGRDIEVGWVFHFIRDAKGRTTGTRYQRLFAKMRADAGRLRRALTLRPNLLSTIRGLDIAGSEREGPLWIAAPQFHLLRAHSRAIARPGASPLQLTIHVGEDFRHLASGLRAIHEPIQWGLIERGDRLGHALALGLDPAKWCANNPRVWLPRWERLLDLAWMIRTLVRPAVGLEPLQGDGFGLALARMRHEMATHLAEIPGASDVEPDTVVKLHGELLGRPETLPMLMARRHDRPGPESPLYVLGLRLFGDTTVQRAFDQPYAVETTTELPLLQALSLALARLVALWQLAIEVNPSSNLLIAGFDDPLDQPIFRLHPLEHDHRPALPITLNADDPLTFSTALADEYAYAWAAMVLVGGVPSGRAHAWLRETGAASWRARFTRPRLHGSTSGP